MEERPPSQRGLVGLANLGNTCYLSSALQCLSQTPALSRPLLEAEGKHSGRVAAACADALRALWATSASDAFAPRELKAAIVERTKTFEGFGQQDAQELLQALLEALHEDLRRPVAAGEVPDDPMGERAPPHVRAEAAWRRSQDHDASLISDLLQGQLRSTVQCAACGHADSSFELFWSLQLPVPQPAGGGPRDPAHLGEALAAFCSDEALDPAWKCEQCGRAESGSRGLCLWRLPPVLQLHVKRFRWHRPASAAPPPAKPAAESSGGAAPAPDSGADPPAPPADGAAGVASPPPLLEGPGGGGGAQSAAAAAAAAAAVARAEAAAASASSAATGGTGGGGAAASQAAVDIPVATAPQSIAAQLPWDQQRPMFVLVLQMLQRIADAPYDPKFRSVAKASGKLRKELLDIPGGAALLQWAGFQEAGDRLENALPGPDAAARRAELLEVADRANLRELRRERDERIELERLRRLPTGDAAPIRRWGGRLPAFGRGAAGGWGLECSKVEVPLLLDLDPGSRRGFAPVRLDRWVCDGAPAGPEARYELYAVVQHLGASPYSGHYVAVCWHEPSGAWWRFNDSAVTRVSADRLVDEVLTGGAYVLFLERAT